MRLKKAWLTTLPILMVACGLIENDGVEGNNDKLKTKKQDTEELVMHNNVARFDACADCGPNDGIVSVVEIKGQTLVISSSPFGVSSELLPKELDSEDSAKIAKQYIKDHPEQFLGLGQQ